MAQYKHYNYDQEIMVPVFLKDQLLPGTLEYTIHTLIENQVDMSVFEAKYNNDETGCYAYDPKILLKSVLFGLARGKLSSRKVESACKENIIFMALTCGQAPDHSTIAAFVSSMEKEIVLIFVDILSYCDKNGLLGGTTFSIDGCKLPGNASKEMSGTFEQLEEKKNRLEKRLAELLREHQDNDTKDAAEKLEKRIQKLDRFLKDNEPKTGRKHKENKSNVTDNDSQMMTTSHGVIQGYNAQAIVDSKNQIIVFADAGNSGQDDEHGSLMIDGAKANLKAIGKDADCLKNAEILGDSNYFSSNTFQKLIDEQINGYIPDKDFRKRDPRFIDGDPRFSIADFEYDVDQDIYTCPAGETLTRSHDTSKNGKKVYRHYASTEKLCSACPFRNRCLAKKTSKRRWLSVHYDEELATFTHKLIAKIDSDEGRQKYNQRFGMIEPVFANIRTQKRMDHFTLRGKKKVNIQWLLYCLVHNIEKCIPVAHKPVLSLAF
jgi:transposase